MCVCYKRSLHRIYYVITIILVYVSLEGSSNIMRFRIVVSIVCVNLGINLRNSFILKTPFSRAAGIMGFDEDSADAVVGTKAI